MIKLHHYHGRPTEICRGFVRDYFKNRARGVRLFNTLHSKSPPCPGRGGVGIFIDMCIMSKNSWSPPLIFTHSSKSRGPLALAPEGEAPATAPICSVSGCDSELEPGVAIFFPAPRGSGSQCKRLGIIMRMSKVNWNQIEHLILVPKDHTYKYNDRPLPIIDR